MALTFRDRLAALGFSSYKLYLRSNHWIGFKRQYRESSLPKRCDICAARKSLALHHKNYKCLGKETFDDVVCLCSECHDSIHRVHKRRQIPLADYRRAAALVPSERKRREARPSKKLTPRERRRLAKLRRRKRRAAERWKERRTAILAGLPNPGFVPRSALTSFYGARLLPTPATTEADIAPHLIAEKAYIRRLMVAGYSAHEIAVRRKWDKEEVRKAVEWLSSGPLTAKDERKLEHVMALPPVVKSRGQKKPKRK